MLGEESTYEEIEEDDEQQEDIIEQENGIAQEDTTEQEDNYDAYKEYMNKNYKRDIFKEGKKNSNEYTIYDDREKRITMDTEKGLITISQNKTRYNNPNNRKKKNIFSKLKNMFDKKDGVNNIKFKEYDYAKKICKEYDYRFDDRKQKKNKNKNKKVENINRYPRNNQNLSKEEFLIKFNESDRIRTSRERMNNFDDKMKMKLEQNPKYKSAINRKY